MSAATHQDDSGDRLAPFNPTHETAIDIAIQLLGLSKNDILFDLGCGDGRFLIQAAKSISGLTCVGLEIDEALVTRGRSKIAGTESRDLADRIEIRHCDVLAEMDKGGSENVLSLLNDATKVFVYLLPKGLKKVKVMLEEASKKRDIKVASYMFSIPDWTPTSIDRSAKGGCPIYLYELENPQGS